MKPVQSIAMGFVIILLTASVGGFDLLPNPIGWVLVLLGVAQLPTGVEHRGLLRTLGTAALVLSAVLWAPPVVHAMADADESLLWASSLPQLLFTLVACHALGTAAHRAGDRRPATWLRIARTLVLMATVLPVLVFGSETAGHPHVAAQAGVAIVGGLVAVLVIVLLFSYAGRPWAVAAAPGTIDGTAPAGVGPSPTPEHPADSPPNGGDAI